MLGTSICPHCNATFHVGEAQINAHLGLVRCETCLELFDFRVSYVAAHSAPQLELPISDEHAIDPALSTDDRIREALTAARQREIFGNDDIHTINLAKEFGHVLTEDAHDIEALLPVEDFHADESHSAQAPAASAAAMGEQQDVEYEFAKKSYRVWPWVVGSCLTLLALFFQATYFFRVEITANFPSTKPVLVSTCKLLNCTLALPQNASLMNIESSDLADAQNHVIFNALLRNHAAYTQAFPNLELTLTDTQDSPQARRIFKPSDYLPATENETTGLLSNREINIKLHLDSQDIKPSGYRLVLFYPQ